MTTLHDRAVKNGPKTLRDTGIGHPAERWLTPVFALSLALGICVGRMAAFWWLAAAGLVVSVALAFGLRTWRRLGAIALAATCLGCLLAYRAYHPTLPEAGMYEVRGVVTQEVVLREDGRVQTILSDVTLNGAKAGRAYWTFYQEEGLPVPDGLVPGAAVFFTARVYHPSGPELPGGFDFREYLLQRGIGYGLYGVASLSCADAGHFSLAGTAAALRHDLSLRLMDLMGPDAGAYAAAMLLGERRFIPDEENEAFRELGISHILSVSGYHVGVLVLMLQMLLRPLHLDRRLRFLMTGLLLSAYCLLTGGDPPVIRAALLYALWETGRLLNRQTPPLHTLSIAAILQLLFSPSLLFSASFQLSYGAMLGLLLAEPVLRRLLTDRLPRLERVAKPVCASVAAQVGILPAQLYWFGELPLISLLSNVLLIGVSSVLMALYWATLFLLGIPGLRDVLGTLASLATQLLLLAVQSLADIAGHALWIRQTNLLTLLGWALLLTGLSVLLTVRARRTRVALCFLGATVLAVSLIPVPFTEVAYTQFSVGEADAALLRDGETAVVIDTGEDGRTLAEYLHRERISVDLLILTHLHADHAGGVAALLDSGIPVAHCYMPVCAREAKGIDPAILALLNDLAASGTQMHELSAGDVLALPSGSLTCLWPDHAAVIPNADANHSSMALLAELCGTRMLLTGDLTSRYEMHAAVPADILKAAHHGSAGSTSAVFLAQVDPQVVLLSCGTAARHEGLAARTGDLPLYDTNEDGAVTIRFTEDGFTVQPYLMQKKEARP